MPPAATAFAERYPGRFPLGTFVVNVFGSFLIGVLMTILTDRAMHPNWRFLLVVGFLGGFTTFSSFEYEAYITSRAADYTTALIYVLGSVIAGFIALSVGVMLASKR